MRHTEQYQWGSIFIQKSQKSLQLSSLLTHFDECLDLLAARYRAEDPAIAQE